MKFEQLEQSTLTLQPRYKSDEYSKDLPVTFGIYYPFGKQHAEEHGWELVETVFKAMDLRRQGKKVLSYREADIAARGKLLDQQIIADALMSPLEQMLTEDDVCLPDSIYELRRLFNRGVQYKKTDYDKQPDAQKGKCDAYINKLLGVFKQNNLSPWPGEIHNGFHVELCRPEFMSEVQYQSTRRRTETVYMPAGGK